MTYFSKTVSQDFNKPLLVPPGADLIESIQGLGSTNNSWTIDKYKHFFTSHFPQESSKTSVLPDDPGQDPNFWEPLIVGLRSQKDEELERYCKEMERKQKIELVF
ncbi:cytoplasmic dynein 2 light intermediate chain 1-like [Lycorma delicatula]|uniref:cytoplasmic dynein 2 light intermediate chain 1-like n=1 Tax=Lycorma delicatula TaxID=130591 RepID=UPI003F514C9A